MPGQSGSEVRQKTIPFTTRWSTTEMDFLESAAAYAGCSKAEILRRLAARSEKQLIFSRSLVEAVRRVGNNVNQIARRLNAGGSVTDVELQAIHAELIRLTLALKS